MTPNEINQAIAEFCGWTDVYCGGPLYDNRMFGRSRFSVTMRHDNIDPVPDYHGNLNATHAAEKNLTNAQRRVYADMLVLTHPLQYDPRNQSDDQSMKLFLISNMTAPQRCEAMLKTIGKWRHHRLPSPDIMQVPCV